MADDQYEDLIRHLRALALSQHDDVSIAADAADTIINLVAERDALVKDAARLKHLEDTGLNLVNDDDGRWAVSDTGLQPVRPTGGFTDTADILCSVYPDNWKDSIREAIDCAMQKDCYEEA